MPGLFITQETLVKAFRAKLGIGPEDEQAVEVWTGFLADPRNAYVLDDLVGRVAEVARQAALCRLDGPEPDGGWGVEPDALRSLGQDVFGLPSGSESVMQPQPHLSGEKILKAIRWKLGIASDNDPRAQEYWNLFCSGQGSNAYKNEVAKELGKLMEEAVRMRLGVRVSAGSPDEQELLHQMWESFRKWFNAVPAPNRYSSKVAEVIANGLPKQGMKLSSHAARQAQAQRPPQPPPQPPANADSQNTLEALPGDPPAPEPPPPPAPPPSPPPPMTSDRTPPVNPGSAWKYKPLPADEPDPHEESQTLSLPVGDGWTVTGARVRGKKHKHEGTHCDDWFEARQSGSWVIIAVSDGAGSSKFSRIGARASCQAAVDFLATQLRERPLRARQTGLLERWWNKDEGVLNADDVKFLEGVLTYSMGVAHDAVKKAADEREESQAHRRYLKSNRKLCVEDLSGTLLLAVATRLKVKGVEYTYAATCSVGDGMMAMIAQGDPPVQLLAEPDSGEHSGETYFLTSRGRLDPAKLKISVGFRPLKALMVMTDGVSDDYFPPDREMLRLYADLVVNRVLAAPPGPAVVGGVEEARAACETDLDVIGPEPARFKLRSAGTFADKMKLTMKDLVANPDMLRAGAATAEADAVTDPAERLRLWLDTYQVRGSFDDRTLVVLHPEERG